MTLCPGKHQTNASFGGDWIRDLDTDLGKFKEWGATAVLTLMEDHELRRYRVEGLGKAVQGLAMEWYQTPIQDGGTPEEEFDDLWPSAGTKLRQHLKSGHRVLVHCRAGLGRTGMVAARLLVEMGVPSSQAILRVRQVRPGTIENSDQEDHVRSVQSLSSSN